MPRKSRIPSLTRPWTAPVVVSTVVIDRPWSLLRGDCDFSLALGVDKRGPIYVDRDVADDRAGERERRHVVVADGQAAGVAPHREAGAGKSEAVGREPGDLAGADDGTVDHERASALVLAGLVKPEPQRVAPGEQRRAGLHAVLFEVQQVVHVGEAAVDHKYDPPTEQRALGDQYAFGAAV